MSLFKKQKSCRLKSISEIGITDKWRSESRDTFFNSLRNQNQWICLREHQSVSLRIFKGLKQNWRNIMPWLGVGFEKPRGCERRMSLCSQGRVNRHHKLFVFNWNRVCVSFHSLRKRLTPGYRDCIRFHTSDKSVCAFTIVLWNEPQCRAIQGPALIPMLIKSSYFRGKESSFLKLTLISGCLTVQT